MTSKLNQIEVGDSRIGKVPSREDWQLAQQNWLAGQGRMILALFFLFALFSLSPLGMVVDRMLHGPYITSESSLYPLMETVLDSLASQAVAGRLVVITGLVLAWRHRSLLPALVAALAEGLFYSTALLKVAFAKDSTRYGEPLWWDGGYPAHGIYGMAFPSGHATEAILLFGTTLLLLRVYLLAHRPALVGHLHLLWLLLICNTVLVSWLLGFHWVTDLGGGLLWGMFLLSVLQWSLTSGVLPWIADRMERQLTLLGRGCALWWMKRSTGTPMGRRDACDKMVS